MHFTEEQLFLNPLRNHRFHLQLQSTFAVFGCVDSAVVFWWGCGSYNSFDTASNICHIGYLKSGVFGCAWISQNVWFYTKTGLHIVWLICLCLSAPFFREGSRRQVANLRWKVRCQIILGPFQKSGVLLLRPLAGATVGQGVLCPTTAATRVSFAIKLVGDQSPSTGIIDAGGILIFEVRWI